MEPSNFPIFTILALCFVAVAVFADGGEGFTLFLALLVTGYLDYLRSQLARHQKALEWFADHIYFHGTPKQGDAPEEILSILGKED